VVWSDTWERSGSEDGILIWPFQKGSWFVLMPSFQKGKRFAEPAGLSGISLLLAVMPATDVLNRQMLAVGVGRLASPEHRRG